MANDKLHQIEIKRLAEEIRKRVSLVDYMQEEGIKLYHSGSKHGANMYSCCCPLHKENTPSFRVYAYDQSWYCYGQCHNGGDIIAFAKEYKGFKSYGQAVGFFASKLGLKAGMSDISLSEMAYEDFLKTICLNTYNDVDANNINYMISKEGKRISRKFKSSKVDSIIEKTYQLLDQSIIDENQKQLLRIKQEILPGLKILEKSFDKKIEDLEELRIDNKSCTQCSLRYNCASVIPGSGDFFSNMMIIGDFPRTEAESPLKQILAEIGYQGRYIWLDHILNCRPENNIFLHKEAVLCRNLWLNKRIELLKPEAIMLLGEDAIKAFLELNNIDLDNIVKEIREYKIKNHNIKLWFNYSPESEKLDEFKNILKSFISNHSKYS